MSLMRPPAAVPQSGNICLKHSLGVLSASKYALAGQGAFDAATPCYYYLAYISAYMAHKVWVAV
jgi:hypothetical protein